MSKDSNYIIRDCTLDDAKAIAEIYNESIIAQDSTMDDEQKTIQDICTMIKAFNKRETILILENPQQVIGWGIIKRYSDRPGYCFCCETSVYLRRNLIGKGYGPIIKAALIDRCREYHYHHLVAKIFSENIASIKYNERFGYEIVGQQKEIGYKQGHWQNITIMQLVLSDTPPTIPEKYH